MAALGNECTWGLGRHADSWSPPQIYRLRHCALYGDLAAGVLTSPPGDAGGRRGRRGAEGQWCFSALAAYQVDPGGFKAKTEAASEKFR